MAQLDNYYGLSGISDLKIREALRVVFDQLQNLDTTAADNVEFNNLTANGTLTVDTTSTLTGDVTASGSLTVADEIVATTGIKYGSTAITTTADGLTTGLIPANTSFAVITSADANNIATLPAGTAGQVINIYVGANGCELRTPASSTATINNVNSDGTNELALGATTSYIAICVATDTWIVRGFTNLGADQAALVPDAA